MLNVTASRRPATSEQASSRRIEIDRLRSLADRLAAWERAHKAGARRRRIVSATAGSRE